MTVHPRGLILLFALTSCTQVATSSTTDDATNSRSWSEFQSVIRQEPSGLYVVDGDTPIRGDKRLKEFFEKEINGASSLTLAQERGVDSIWDKRQRINLSYCVSKDFQARYDQVVAAMAEAGQAWAAVADVKFVHLAALDGTCTEKTVDVLFNVSPTPSSVSYLARAFFPSSQRVDRNVLIDQSAFTSTTSGMSLAGILRHELGHTLGFRHEHTRPEAGACFEDLNWRPLTEYDPLSVMHYPQCNGKNTWALPLSELDIVGVRRIYGLPGGGQSSGGTQTVTQRFADSALVGAPKVYGPFSAAQGTVFKAVLSGSSGDADLYVRAGVPPTLDSYDCRPFADDSAEACSLDVKTSSNYYVLVNGYSKKVPSVFALSVTTEAPVNQPLNDRCETAQPLRLTQAATVVVANAGQAAPRTGPSCNRSQSRALAYALSFTQPTGLIVRATSSSAEALTLSIEEACSTGHEVGCAAGGRLMFKQLSAGSYTLWVNSATGADFSLEIRTFDPRLAPTNETRETAQPITLVNGKAHVAGDTFLAQDDATTTCGKATPDLVYAVTLAKESLVSIKPKLVDGTLPAIMVERGTSLDGTCTRGFNSWFGPGIGDKFVKLAAGTTFIWVESVTPWAKFEFDLEAWPMESVANDDCSTAQPVLKQSDSQVVQGSTIFATSQSKYLGNDVAYSVTLTEPRVLKASLTDGARMQGSLGLAIQSTCNGSALTRFGNSRTFEQTLPAGTYTLWVGSSSPDSAGDFTLTLGSTPVPAAPPNDACAAAQLIDLEKGPLTVTGSTRGAHVDASVMPAQYYSAYGNASPDVAYRFTLTKNEKVSIRQDYTTAAVAIFSVVAQCGGPIVAENTFDLAATLAPGSYVLWVKLHDIDTWQTGDFSLKANVTP